jgi:hypothetical protein
VVEVRKVGIAGKEVVVGVAVGVVGVAGRVSGVAGRDMPVAALDNQAEDVALAAVGIAVRWLVEDENRPVVMAVVAVDSIAALRLLGSLAEAVTVVEDHVADMEIWGFLGLRTVVDTAGGHWEQGHMIRWAHC